jgi:hypothetical protein
VTSPGGGNDRISFSIGAEDDGATRTLGRVADGMDDVSRLSKELRKARDAEANAAGQVRVAEAKLNDARTSGKAKASQLAAAEEGLAKAQRNLTSSRDIATDFQGKLAKAQASAASEIKKTGRSLGSQMVGSSADAAEKGGRRAFLSVGKSLGGGLRAGIVQPLAGLQGLVGGVIAGAGLASFFKDAVLGASDLNETVSKTKVIFGQSGDAIIDWSKNAVTSMGLTQQQALGAASSFGDMFLQLGLTGKQATGMSTQMVQLAADLASFNNADITDVLEAQSGAFRGEFDSIQRFIPNISAARVEQVALGQSHKKTTAELTAQDKVLATQAILLQDSSRASGDFARTSSGTANQMRILQANFSEFLTDLGQKFLPLVNRGVTELNAFIGPLGEMVDFIAALPPGVFAGAAALAGFIGTAKVATGVTGKLSDGVQSLIERGGGFEASGGRLSNATKGFGAALRGAALSINPVTVGLAAAAAAVGFYAQKKAEAKRRVEDFTAAVQQDSGALGENTRQLVAHTLEQDGALRAAQMFGLNLKDVTDAVLGNQQALGRINGVLDAYKASQQEAVTAGDTVNATTQDSNEAYTKLRDTLGSTTSAVSQAAAAAQRQTAATGPATGAITQNTTAVKAQGQTAEEAAAKVQGLITKMFALGAANGDVASADISFRNSLAQLTQSVKDNGTSLDLNKQKGRDNRSAVIQSITAAQQYATAVGAQTGNQDKARKAFQDSIPQIREQARRLGLNKKEVDALIGSIAKLQPKAVSVRAVVSVVDAISGGVRAAAVDSSITRRNTTGSGTGRAFGGPVPGFSPGDRSDNVPIMATAGEFMIQRPTVRKIQRQAPGFLEALNSGRVDVGGDTGNLRASVGRDLRFAQGGSIPSIQAKLRATDPLPYVWGAAGPGGYDCSGLVGAAYGALTGKGGFGGQRYFTTDSIGTAQGFRSGLGTFSVGVTPGRGHMAGQLGSLKFEARSTASGIHVGPSALPVTSFARHFFLPQFGGTFGAGDELTSRQKGQIFQLIRPDIARDLVNSLSVQKFDSGGLLPPGLSLAANGTGRHERIRTGAQEDALAAKLDRIASLLASMPLAQVDDRYIRRTVRYGDTRDPNGW